MSKFFVVEYGDIWIADLNILTCLEFVIKTDILEMWFSLLMVLNCQK